MNYRTRQEIFNVAYRGLASQGFRRSTNDMGCAYRGDGGRRCAIGWCISDAEYNRDFEGTSPAFGDPKNKDFFYHRRADIRKAARISDSDATFARELQARHDEGTSPASLQSMLESFAKLHDLTIPEGFDDFLTAQEPETQTPVTELEAV